MFLSRSKRSKTMGLFSNPMCRWLKRLEVDEHKGCDCDQFLVQLSFSLVVGLSKMISQVLQSRFFWSRLFSLVKMSREIHFVIRSLFLVNSIFVSFWLNLLFLNLCEQRSSSPEEFSSFKWIHWTSTTIWMENLFSDDLIWSSMMMRNPSNIFARSSHWLWKYPSKDFLELCLWSIGSIFDY